MLYPKEKQWYTNIFICMYIVEVNNNPLKIAMDKKELYKVKM